MYTKYHHCENAFIFCVLSFLNLNKILKKNLNLNKNNIIIVNI